MQNDIDSLNANMLRRDVVYNQPKTLLSKLLPILLFLTFVWLNFYDTLTELNSISIKMEDMKSYLTLSVFFAGLFDYVIFELLFFVYRFCLGFSIYSFMIPKNVLIDKFRFWYMARNIVLGIFYNLRFFFPYFGTYLCIFELVLNFAFIVGLYFDLSKNYVEPLVGQFVFKSLAVPVVIYEIYAVIVLMVGVL